MSTLDVSGAALNYEIWSEATPAAGASWVTLVNGHTRPLNDFRMLGKKFVGAGFAVLALDNRGSGETAIDRDFTLSDMVGDVQALWSKHEIKSTSLLGISMGGFIAQTLALDYPESIERLVLVSTASRHRGIKEDDRPWTNDVQAVAAKLASYFTPEFAVRNAVLVRSMAKQIANQVDAGKFVENSKQQRQALQGFDVSARLFAVAAPTLVIHGTEDAIIPESEGRALAEGIPGADFVAIDRCGHLLLAEAPARLYQLVLDFLRP